MSASGYRSLWFVLMDFKVLLFAFILLFSEIQQGLPLTTGTPKLQSTIYSILRNAAFLHNLTKAEQQSSANIAALFR